VKPFDRNGNFIFPISGGGDALKRLAVRSAGVTIFSGSIALAIQVIATVVLARLLTPLDFGLVAMVTTFSLLLMNFGGNGFTEVVVQREEMNHAIASDLFWINLSGGTLLTIGFAAAGALLAKFFEEPQVQKIAVGMSASIFLSSTSVLHLALLRRAMRFSAVSINDIVARAISVVVSVALGFAGWGYWALVAGACALPLSTTVGAWILCRWMPGPPRRVSGISAMLWYAIHTYGRFSLNYCVRNTDNLLVGWRFGAHSLGYYKKAYDLFALSANQLVSSTTLVAVSALSRIRNDRAEYRRYLLGAMSVVTFLGMGLASDLTLIGRDLIRLLLGRGWGEAGQIFTFFAPGIGAMILYGTHGWIHLSIGRADRWFRWGIVELIVTGLLFVGGLHWGPEGIAMAWCASFWILTIPAMWYAGKPIELGIGTVLSAVWKSTVASVLAGLATGLIFFKLVSLSSVSGVSGAALRVAVVSMSFGCLYLGAIGLLYRGFLPLKQLLTVLHEMILRGGATKLTKENVSGNGGSPMKVSVGEASLFKSGEQLLVSILIPAYNSQDWIASAIRSALGQTWKNKEIIVVDDGSTDQTMAVARQFESSGVRIVSQSNQGASAARNAAYALSRGDYIQWLDADDILAPDKIAQQMDALGKIGSSQILLSSSWARFMYRPHRAKFRSTALWDNLTPVEWLLRKMEQNIYMQTATWLVSRQLTEAAGPWDTRLTVDDDGEYFCRVLMASDGVRFVPESRVFYRSFGYDSLSYMGHSARKCQSHWLSMQLHIFYLRSLEDSDRSRTACLRYLKNNLIYFYPEEVEFLEQAQELAADLGWPLEAPSLSWQYAMARAIMGWSLANRTKMSLRRVRWRGMRFGDWVISQFDRETDATRAESEAFAAENEVLVTGGAKVSDYPKLNAESNTSS
jgi:polysaccharide transporter, PST family